MNHLKLLLLLTGFLLAFMPAHAQTGFHGGLRVAYTSISWDDTTFDENDKKGRGPGLGLAIGYGFNPIYTMMVSLSAHNLNDGAASTQYAEIVGRFHLGQNNIQPFLEAGVMGTLFRYEDVDVRFSGPGYMAGAGLRASITNKLSLELGFRPTRARYEKVRVGKQSNDIDAVKTWHMRSYVGLSVYID
jgi:opacity protein-like surface antigen